MNRRGTAALLAVVIAVGCGHQGAQSPSAATTTGLLPAGVPTEGSRPPAATLPPAAEPQRAPQPAGPPPGRLVPVAGGPEGVAVDPVTRIVAVASHDPDRLVLLNADSLQVAGRTPLPGSARHVESAGPGGPILVPVESANALVEVRLPGGAASPPILTGTSPHDAAAASNGTVFVGNELGGTVAAVRDGKVVKLFTDSVQPAGLAAAGTAVGMLDARRNTLTVYDAQRLAIIGSAPAGAGPTHLVADRRGRMIAADTRGDAIRVFDPLPTPREIAAVRQPGGPYGIAYDGMRDRLWVASSGTNEVVGYDVSGAVPLEIRRIPTVQDPYSVGVDSQTGHLFIAGVTAGVLQVVEPGL
ncbi:YncE family protein [Mycobacterium sp. 94-17]|uniref:Vgb family protein n=1 Tax=Mycobacterium sp. 94-17 TaxID=2986147 RepID=UPI002D1E6406|nr:YncE family protein [Mycobacterium sp. 94-17]MEB4208552.1 YncE family protein [Mycobacterium sp. 94-17]